VSDKATMNSENAIESGNGSPNSLKEILNNSKYFVIFNYEMPFFLVMRRSLGYALKGKRAKTPVHPVGEMSYRIQFAMEVYAHKGVLFGGMLRPKYSQPVSKDDSIGSETLKAKWNKAKFKDYLGGLLRSLFTRRDELGLRGKHFVLLVDGVLTTDLKKDMPKLLGEREHHTPLN